MDVMNFTTIIAKAIFQPNYIHDYFVNSYNPSLQGVSPTFINFIKDLFLTQYYFDELIAFGPKLFQIIIPLFAAVSGIEFYRYFHSLYLMRFSREKKYRKFITQQIIWNSMKLALSIFCAYFIFLVIVQLISDPTLNQDSIARHFLLDVFGNNLIINHKFLYYFIEGSIRFLLIPFVYSCLAQASVLYFDNLKEVIAAPIVYYYLLTFIGYGFAVFGNDIYIYFSPAVIMSNGSFSNLNSLLLIIMNMMPLFIAIPLIYWRMKYVEI